MSKILKRFFPIVLLSALALLFQNCGGEGTKRIQNKMGGQGTTIGNPFTSGEKYSKVAFRFSGFDSDITDLNLCLTNIRLRMNFQDTPIENVELPIGEANGGFDTSYFYYDDFAQKYYVNGSFLTKRIPLKDIGAHIADLLLPSGDYDEAVFGFSPCSDKPSLEFTNSHGQFQDGENKKFAIFFRGEDELIRGATDGFSLEFLTDKFESVSAAPQLDHVLTEYRDFELIGLTTFALPTGFDQIRLNRMAEQSTGHIISAGWAHVALDGFRFLLARYTHDGQLDPQFGNGKAIPGVISISVSSTHEGITGLAIDASDRIYAFGESTGELQIFRFNANGSPDTTFGTNGKVKYLRHRADLAKDMILLKDSGILVVGANRDRNNQFFLIKFDRDGNVDTRFGNQGVALKQFNLLNYFYPMTLAEQNDGKILLISDYNEPAGGASWLIDRYLPNGNYDTSFNANGSLPGRLRLQPQVGRNEGKTILPLDDGKILAAGVSNSDYAVAKLNSDGTLDSSFGSGGFSVQSLSEGDEFVSGMALDDLGRILVSGLADIGGRLNYGLLVLNPDGQPDTNVSTQSFRIFTASSAENGASILQQQTGKIAIGGASSRGFNLLRLQQAP